MVIFRHFSLLFCFRQLLDISFAMIAFILFLLFSFSFSPPLIIIDCRFFAILGDTPIDTLIALPHFAPRRYYAPERCDYCCCFDM